LQQQGERAVGQQFASGLAAGTVVRLVVGVTDALHLNATPRTRLTEFAVDGHLRTERRDLLGKITAGFLAQQLTPAFQPYLSRPMQAICSFSRQSLRPRYGR